MVDIPRRMLGRTGLEVSTLGFGAMELRGDQGGPQITDEDAGRLLNTVLDEGINLIDTSIDYGRSEELIGKYVARRRAEYVLASKCGCVSDAGMGTDHIHTAENIRDGGRAQPAHCCAQTTSTWCSSTAASAATEFDVEERWPRRWPCATRKATASSECRPTCPPSTSRSTWAPSTPSRSRTQRCNASTRWSSRARPRQGRGSSSAAAWLAVRPMTWEGRRYYMVANETMRDFWDTAKLDELLDGMSRTAFLLRFTLSNPDLDTTIVGTSSIEHLRANLAAAAGRLPAARRRAPRGQEPAQRCRRDRRPAIGPSAFDRRDRDHHGPARRSAGPPMSTAPFDYNAQIIAEFRANHGTGRRRASREPRCCCSTRPARDRGRRYTNPLVYLADGGRYVVFASKAGAPTNPDWYHNLKAHPRGQHRSGRPGRSR